MQSIKPKITLSYPSDVFAVAVHPSKPVVAAGLSTGYVIVNKYASEENSEDARADSESDSEPKEGISYASDQMWKTRRHKGSCRNVAFDEDGSYLVLKQASSKTGKVVAKNTTEIESEPSALAVTKNNILVGTESGKLQIFDPRTSKAIISYDDLHEDYITSISHLAQYQNTYQFITTGSTTVTRIDIRKGKLSTSEDQEDEILSSCISYPAYFEYDPHGTGGIAPEKRVPVTAVMGMSTGVLTFWTKNNWEDQQGRAILSEESIDCVEEYPNERIIAAGADGIVRLVDVRKRKTTSEFHHGGEDGVTGLSVDAWGRIISGGGQTLKVWSLDDNGTESVNEQADDWDSDDSDSEHGSVSDSSDEGKKKKKPKSKKRKRGKAKNRIAAKAKTVTRANFSDMD